MPPGPISRKVVTQDALRNTPNGRPWINELFNVFACLVEALELGPHKEYFKTIQNSFTNFEAIEAMQGLSFYVTDRELGSDGKWTSKTTTYTLRADAAGTTSLIMHFCQARLLSTHGTVSGDRLCIFTLSPKGLHVLERVLDSHNMEDRMRGSIGQPILERLLHFQRYLRNDEIIMSEQVVFDSFRRFVGLEPNFEPTEKESLKWDEFKKHHKRSLGIQLIVSTENQIFSRFGRSNAPIPKHAKKLFFGGYEAIAWLVDFMNLYGSKEAGSLAAQFVRHGLIEIAADKRKTTETPHDISVASGPTNCVSGRIIPQVAEFIGLGKVTYKITDEGRRVAQWSDSSKKASNPADGAGSGSRNASDGVGSTNNASKRSPNTAGPKDSNSDRLNQIIKDPRLCLGFRKFLSQTHCLENLQFYLEVQNLERDFAGLARVERPNAPKSGQMESRRQLAKLTERARAIFDTFLAEGSESELNLDHGQRHNLLRSVTNIFGSAPGSVGKAVDTGQLHDVVLVQYRKIQDHVFRLMADDSVQNFILTPEYSSHKRKPLTKPQPRSREPLFVTKNDQPSALRAANQPTEETARVYFTTSYQAIRQLSKMSLED